MISLCCPQATRSWMPQLKNEKWLLCRCKRKVIVDCDWIAALGILYMILLSPMRRKLLSILALIGVDKNQSIDSFFRFILTLLTFCTWQPSSIVRWRGKINRDTQKMVHPHNSCDRIKLNKRDAVEKTAAHRHTASHIRYILSGELRLKRFIRTCESVHVWRNYFSHLA